MISSSDRPKRSSVYSSALSATRSVNVARASSAVSTAGACLLEHCPRLVEATRGDEVVEEAGEVAGAQGLGKVGQAQGEASGPDPDLGRDREHAGDAEADFRLLQGGQRLAERAVGERDRLLAVAGDVQRDRRRADDLPALRMVGRCDLERALSELRGGPGIGRDQRLRGVEQRRDRHLVTDLGAGGELHGDFDRQGAGFEQDDGGLAVERAAGGYRARWRGRPRG